MTKLAAALGKPAMPWQSHVADVALEVGPDGHLRYRVVVLTVPRQAGKTTLLRPLYLRPMLTVMDASCWVTAQKREYARDIWDDTVTVLERSPLARLLKIRRANGSESLTVRRTSGKLRPFAPVEDALHSKTTHVVGVDEAWAFDAARGKDLLQAIVPTQITVRDSQLWIVSTAGKPKSEFLRSYVRRAHQAFGAGGAPPFAYFEWSVPADQDPTDLATVAAHHPAYGHTIDMAGLRAARDAMEDDAEYARAYGNVWAAADAGFMDERSWVACRFGEPIAGPLAFATEISPDRDEAVILAAGPTASGRIGLEIIDQRDGNDWVQRRLQALMRHDPVAIVVDPHSPARGLAAALADTEMPVLAVDTAGFITAWDGLVDLLKQRALAHDDARLDKAVEAATGRRVREQWVIARSGPATPLVAAALAAHGWFHPVWVKPPPLIVAGR